MVPNRKPFQKLRTGNGTCCYMFPILLLGHGTRTCCNRFQILLPRFGNKICCNRFPILLPGLITCCNRFPIFYPPVATGSKFCYPRQKPKSVATGTQFSYSKPEPAQQIPVPIQDTLTFFSPLTCKCQRHVKDAIEKHLLPLNLPWTSLKNSYTKSKHQQSKSR